MSQTEEHEERVSTLEAPYRTQDIVDLGLEGAREVFDNAFEALGVLADQMAEQIKAIKKLQRKHRGRTTADDAPAADRD